jgi:hypothetical protein
MGWKARSSVAERVTVVLLHRCSGPGAHVGKEQTGADLGGEFHKVLVTPRRRDAAKQCRFCTVLIPAQPRAVAVHFGAFG